MSVFFTSRNTGFKSQLDTSSIPPWYLAVYWVSLAFSYRNPNSFLIPGGSIENGSASSIASQHLVDRLSFCAWYGGLFLDTCSTPSSVNDHFLNTYLDNLLNTSRHLRLSRFTDGLYILLVRSAAHFCRSFSRYLCLFNSQTLTQIFFLKVSSSFFKILLTW